MKQADYAIYSMTSRRFGLFEPVIRNALSPMFQEKKRIMDDYFQHNCGRYCSLKIEIHRYEH